MLGNRLEGRCRGACGKLVVLRLASRRVFTHDASGRSMSGDSTMQSRPIQGTILHAVVCGLLGALAGCSTAPPRQDQSSLLAEARATTDWFESNVTGLASQLDDAGGYVVYPAVGQFGLGIGGGKFGRGVVYDGNGRQIGWASINTASAGLQLGAQGFKMLAVFQDSATLDRFRQHRLTGSAAAIAVVADAGGSGAGQFENGVVIYQGANTGLMAGVNVGLDVMRFEAVD